MLVEHYGGICLPEEEPVRRVGRKRYRSEFGFLKAPLERMAAYLDETIRLLVLYSTGVARLQGAHGLAIALTEAEGLFGDDDVSPEEREARLDRERNFERLAKEEVESGYRLLSAHVLVGTWGVMESSVDDWVIEWISRRPHDLELEIAELKLPTASYMTSSVQERARALFEVLRRRQGHSLGAGVTRFERPLDLVGLSASVPDLISDALFEMHKVRNVCAHNGGRADRQFIEDCPWFGLKRGSPVPLTSSMINGYISILTHYLVLLYHRAHARVGIRLRDSVRYWDPQITVAVASREAESELTVPPCVLSLPIVQSRHRTLLGAQSEAHDASADAAEVGA